MRRLNDVIVLLVPSLNPDGQIMVTEWYRKYLGTKYEGGALPYLYHHYVGMTIIVTGTCSRMIESKTHEPRRLS